MKSKLPADVVGISVLILLAAVLTAAPGTLSQTAAQTDKKAAPAAPAQKAFATPEEAAKALIQAAGLFDIPVLKEILGPDGADLVSSDDPVRDKNFSLEFAARSRAAGIPRRSTSNRTSGRRRRMC